jgi:hypothetical protein
MGHAGSDDLQASGFKAGVDLADDVLGNGIRLDDGEGTFDGHVKLPVGFQRILPVWQSLLF